MVRYRQRGYYGQGACLYSSHDACVLIPTQHWVFPILRPSIFHICPSLQELFVRRHPCKPTRNNSVDIFDSWEVDREEDIEVTLMNLWEMSAQSRAMGTTQNIPTVSLREWSSAYTLSARPAHCARESCLARHENHSPATDVAESSDSTHQRIASSGWECTQAASDLGQTAS